MKVYQKGLAMQSELENKIYFTPGMMVTLKKDIPNKPVMLVVRKETSIFKHADKDNILKGIRCMWFNTNGDLHEYVFNTKDLQIIE